MMYTILLLFCHGVYPVKNNQSVILGQLVGFASKRIACALNTHWKEFERFKCLLLSHIVVDVQVLLYSRFIYHLAVLSLGSLCCDKPCNYTVHEAVNC